MINKVIAILITLLIEKTKNKYIQFLRYGLVAGVSLIVDFGILVLLVEVFGMHHIAAATISFIFGIAANYKLSSLWVFHSSKLTNRKKELTIFITIGFIGLIMTDIILWILTDRFGIFYAVSKAIAVVIVYFWNFGVRKKLLFN